MNQETPQYTVKKVPYSTREANVLVIWIRTWNLLKRLQFPHNLQMAEHYQKSDVDRNRRKNLSLIEKMYFNIASRKGKNQEKKMGGF